VVHSYWPTGGPILVANDSPGYPGSRGCPRYLRSCAAAFTAAMLSTCARFPSSSLSTLSVGRRCCVVSGFARGLGWCRACCHPPWCEQVAPAGVEALFGGGGRGGGRRCGRGGCGGRRQGARLLNLFVGVQFRPCQPARRGCVHGTGPKPVIRHRGCRSLPHGRPAGSRAVSGSLPEPQHPRHS
jgi:hypothetical protein